MRKLAISFIISAIFTNIAFAEHAKYELGQYNFDFSGEKEQQTIEIKNNTPVKTEINTINIKPQIQKSNPVADNLKMQKEIINKVKEEEKKVEKNLSKDINKTEDSVKKEIKSIETETKTIEEQIKKSKPQNNKKKNEKPISNKKKQDASQMPFQFKIMEMDVIPKETRTIEKL